MKINTLKEAQQAAFNGAVRGLSYQEWKQCGSGRSCYWNLGKPGFHCAIGWLIPWSDQEKDELSGDLSRALDEKKLSPVLQDWMYQNREDRVEFITLLSSMQSAHDAPTEEPGNMRSKFESVARRYDLTWPKDVA